MANGPQARGPDWAGPGRNFQASGPPRPKRAEKFFNQTIFVGAKPSKISYVFSMFNIFTKLIKYSPIFLNFLKVI